MSSAPSQRDGRLDFWQIAMKPGRPLAFGRLGDAVFVGLPGNPVATMVCFLLFARPVLLRLAGFAWRTPTAFPVPAAFALTKRAGPQRVPARPARAATPHGRLAGAPDRARGLGHSDLDGRGAAGWSSSTTRSRPSRPGDPVPFLSFAELGIPA